MPSKRSLLIFVFSVIVPALCFIGLSAFNNQLGVTTADRIGMLSLAPLNVAFISIPQLVCFSLLISRRIALNSFLGGLICADLLIVAFTIGLLVLPNDGDSMGWLLYFAVCVPLVPVGMLLGKLAGDAKGQN